MVLVLKSLLIGAVTLTAYQSLPSQTDSSPFYTSTNEHVRYGGVAVSRDLLCGACRKLHHRCKHPEYAKKIHYGDWLFTHDIGFLRVNDVMGSYTSHKVHGRWKRTPITQHIDVWVGSLAQERAFHKKWKGKAVELWKVEVTEK